MGNIYPCTAVDVNLAYIETEALEAGLRIRIRIRISKRPDLDP